MIGSNTSTAQNEAMERMWRRSGFQAHFVLRHGGAGEQLVDDAIVSQISRDLRPFDGSTASPAVYPVWIWISV